MQRCIRIARMGVVRNDSVVATSIKVLNELIRNRIMHNEPRLKITTQGIYREFDV